MTVLGVILLVVAFNASGDFFEEVWRILVERRVP